MARLAFTNTIMLLPAWGKREAELAVTSGGAGISIGMRYTNAFAGVGTNMTPAQARELAADLIARADEIEGTD
jgi:hypothetical protein